MIDSRREFLGTTLAAAMASAAPGDSLNRISLAAWSLNRSYEAGKWKNLDLPGILHTKLAIDALEYVNGYFENPRLSYLRQLKKRCADNGVTSVLIMVDDEDPMAAVDKNQRMEAAIAHRKWIDISHFLGGHAIRCNMRGSLADWKNDKDLVERAAESFHGVLEYARGSGLQIMIENHGGSSSDPEVLTALMKKVDDPNFGMMVDFGNWNKGTDHYEAIRKVVPWAKDISVKDIPGWDLEKKLQICLESGYHGYWGIESSSHPTPGSTPDQIFEADIEAVLKVKSVLERVVLRKA